MVNINDFVRGIDISDLEIGQKVYVRCNHTGWHFRFRVTKAGYFVALKADNDRTTIACLGERQSRYTQVKMVQRESTAAEKRVYVVNLVRRAEKYPRDMSDEEFMQEAEEQGTVYTLGGFAEKFNKEIDSSQQTIRII